MCMSGGLSIKGTWVQIPAETLKSAVTLMRILSAYDHTLHTQIYVRGTLDIHRVLFSYADIRRYTLLHAEAKLFNTSLCQTKLNRKVKGKEENRPKTFYMHIDTIETSL